MKNNKSDEIYIKKVEERRLQWNSHVMRMSEEYFGRRVMEMEVQDRWNRSRPKVDSVREDLRERRLTAEEVLDRTAWEGLL